MNSNLCGVRGWRPLNGRPGLRMAVWLQIKALGLDCAAYSLYSRSVCDTKALLQLLYAACRAK